jgi:hypothetical protein
MRRWPDERQAWQSSTLVACAVACGKMAGPWWAGLWGRHDGLGKLIKDTGLAVD